MGGEPWDEGDALLAAIELCTARTAWLLSSDGQRGRNAPQPLKSPQERKAARDRASRAIARKREIDRILGVTDA